MPAGVVAAARKGRWLDHVIRVVGLFGYSVPVFWLGLVGLFVFYGKLGWVAGTGRLDVAYDDDVTPRTGVMLIDCSARRATGRSSRNAFSHLILPARLLGYFSLAYIARMTRSFMIDQLGQEYVTAARIKGRSFWGAVWRHAFPNILVPLITVIGLSYASLLEGAVLTETVFAWPGLGLYITHSLFNADMNAVLGGTIVVGAVFIGINLICDLLYKLVDPRLRAHECTDTPVTRAWLADRRARRRAGRPWLGSAYRAWRRDPAATRLAVVGSDHRRPAGPAARSSRRCSPSADSPIAQDLRGPARAAQRRALVRHRRTRPRHLSPASLYGARVTLAIVALVSVIVAPIGLAVGTVAGYIGRLGRRGADAHHRHLPRLPEPRAGAGLRRGARARHRQCGDRHLAHRLAALCAPRPRRNRCDRAQRLHRGRGAAGRLDLRASCCATSCRSACPR